jgi:hypothetical protein
MMSSSELTRIQEQAERLSPSEQIQLIEFLTEKLRQEQSLKRYSWMKALGAAPYPLLGEDAQEWVSRTRQESDDARSIGADNQL